MSEAVAPEPKPKGVIGFIEKAGKKIPDPVIIFMFLFVFSLVVTGLAGGVSFETLGRGGEAVQHEIKNMLQAEHIRWMFDNALLKNWLAFGHGVLGVILIVMLGIGIAENSGLLTAVIKKVGLKIPDKLLPALIVFLGIMSSIAADAGYLVLIPLAGLLYAGLGKNPLIGMAAAFAGVSAGFSANLLPATPADVVLGVNAKIFAESQGVPFVGGNGEALNPATMHYFFILVSTFVLAAVGAWVTAKFVSPRLEKMSYQLPEEINFDEFELNAKESKGLRWAGLGLIASLVAIYLMATGPLGTYTNEAGKEVTPYLDNVILLISLVFAVSGLCFGYATGKFKNLQDVVKAMVTQMNTMGYILVLTFFCYNFLALLSYSGLGTYVTYLGATFLQSLGLQKFPVLLIIGFIITTALINLFVGGLTSKWMLLGPIFVPMLYQVNPNMTPDLVTAAYRVADSSTNIITPMMSYAGVILAFMRKYKPELTFGDVIAMMVPYSVAFLTIWTAVLIGFFSFSIPLGF
ncbi:Putative p-aminobenzoyl-glutamate transporter [Vibrio nigripulchritudo MADA3029]|uniref:Putative p-aminobenzoyl-glutamate transporter n=1 Tax=Vibrio nigripulchritudo TaxID=28173 RepID=U4KDE0_9VIBR|nr:MULTISPECIES: AbgT family transporter [Vibrio]KJY80364.1 aminobenzoyl-glutamate transporter [Vibrio nigripulchritudo]UAB71172.1 AbgT family transporter [Vibrio sp. SCSIO 43132]CCN47029.1 Putative p-aminobenzoyl-glutamate transporter [Vibrio nigripulchritudo MADA3020]CCN50972.1 Putative p-aminobenzoyl-glutamate transporter [Vibrio nigripulchritudo MADA3021]CCN60490.1 Putative p-aminobenzoyl-glutamate transporter [Vibrio nigripulchritudo MADA3029]